MKSRKGPIALIVVGSLFTLGPFWGVMGTVLGMMRAFDTLAHSIPVEQSRLSADISLALYATWGGLVMAPIGLALLIFGIMRLVRVNRAQQDSGPSNPQTRLPIR